MIRLLIFLESGRWWLWDTRNPSNTSLPIWLVSAVFSLSLRLWSFLRADSAQGKTWSVSTDRKLNLTRDSTLLSFQQVVSFNEKMWEYRVVLSRRFIWFNNMGHGAYWLIGSHFALLLRVCRYNPLKSCGTTYLVFNTRILFYVKC